MSSTRTLILGVLLDGPLHGYEVRRRLESWGTDQWASVAYGSIYHGLGKMADEGLLRRVEEGRGGRTVYEITEAGRAEFMRLLMDHWWELKPIVDPFQVALTFMDRLSPADLAATMRGRAAQLRAAVGMLDRAIAAKRAHGAPRHVDETLKLNAAQFEAQLTWIEDALTRVEKGELP
ncbi:PadR family transcriptional regulator [Planomonospora corallina]|uniref:PadR family transcriptional regulator n=1 Tax=Planomonospora corallina TaxID=1806052 RepID=A0ABV8I3A3_9ACTN